MRHLTDDILREAHGRPSIASRMKHLDMFGVIGIIGYGDIRILIDFVKQHIANVRYSEQRGLIWMPSVGEKLDRQFSGLKQREALPPSKPTVLALIPWKSDIKDI